MTVKTVLTLLAALLIAACSPPDKLLRAIAYGEIASARIAAGDPAGARDAARLAIEAAEAAEDGDERMLAELAAAVAQLRVGHRADAKRRADALPDEADRVVVLSGLAMALANAGFDGEARLAAAEATDLAAGLERDEADEYWAIMARSAAGDFYSLPGQVAAIGDDRIRNSLLILIAEDQAADGDFAGALATAALIDGGRETVESDIYMTGRILQAAAGDSLAVARDLLFDPRVPARIVALNRIAVLQARQGDTRGAATVLALALEHAGSAYADAIRAQALIASAVAQAVTGDRAGALETLRRAEALLDDQIGERQGDASRAVTFALAVRDAIEGGRVAENSIGRPGFAGDPNELLVVKALSLVRLGQTGAARETLDFTTRNALRDSDRSITAATYAILAAKQAELGDIAGAGNSAQRALLVAEDLSDPSQDRVIAMFFATLALTRAGILDLAQETAARIELKEPEPVE